MFLICVYVQNTLVHSFNNHTLVILYANDRYPNTKMKNLTPNSGSSVYELSIILLHIIDKCNILCATIELYTLSTKSHSTATFSSLGGARRNTEDCKLLLFCCFLETFSQWDCSHSRKSIMSIVTMAQHGQSLRVCSLKECSHLPVITSKCFIRKVKWFFIQLSYKTLLTIFKYKLVYAFGNFAVFVRISTQYILQQIKPKLHS